MSTEPSAAHRLLRLVKTRIVATVGPASDSPDILRQLVLEGVDIFRLNFAHGSHDHLAELVRRIRRISAELDRPIGLLGDLSGPKIRLNEVPDGEVYCEEGQLFRFVRSAETALPGELSSTYEALIDDVNAGDRILLADGTVGMRVETCDPNGHWVECRVFQAGRIRSRQGINLPGVALSTASVTDKDREDLAWALQQKLDFVGLSFVRSAADIEELQQLITADRSRSRPLVVAKIEKTEAIDDLENILHVTDAVMVARGDLGVEADISRIPVLQKQIIRRCNQLRIPVITATQMLDSMQTSEIPTRAEATDVANAILDGTDAVMLSGETAIGERPVQCVRMMERIAREAETLVQTITSDNTEKEPRRARPITEAVSRAAAVAAESLNAGLIVAATVTGRTALALSRMRTRVPIVACTDQEEISRRMCLYWGVTSRLESTAQQSADQLLQSVVAWAKKEQVVEAGSAVILVGHAEWLAESHDLMLVHIVK